MRRHTITAGETLVLTNPNRWMGNADWNDWRDGQYLGDLGRGHKLVALESDWVQTTHQQELQGVSEWPSTGYVAMAFALALAIDVGAPPPSVYGFGACAPCPKVAKSSTQLRIPSLPHSASHPIPTPDSRSKCPTPPQPTPSHSVPSHPMPR